RDGAAQAAGRDRERPPEPGGHRRTLRENPHVQFPRQPNHRSPLQVRHAPADGRAQRRSVRAARTRHHALSVREAQGRDGRLMSSVHARVAGARESLRDAGLSPTEADLGARLLAEHILGWDAVRYFTSGGDPEPEDFAAKYAALVSRRALREPLAYITGRQNFWDLSFDVSPDVLIPRPETELIVDAAIELLREHPRNRRALRIADACTGSGCLAVSIARELPHAHVIATDVSDVALVVARRNAARHGVEARVRFVRTDVLGGVA